jgi:GNAT superfamily N-acetyltransferase
LTHQIRAAQRADIKALRQLIMGLAEYEKLAHMVVCQDSDLERALFGDKPECEALLMFHEDALEPVGFALFFHNFSTFLGKPGLYLEDLFIKPEYRGHGLGQALLIHLAGLAVARGCGRVEWAVLDWNVDAQGFYQKLGATVMPDWRITRVTGDALLRLASMS